MRDDSADQDAQHLRLLSNFHYVLVGQGAVREGAPPATRGGDVNPAARR
ncbi:MAG: hypothetical protein ACRD6R_13815 [Candidatus Polarisedimenticolia bacterium]